jgi:hypothetical protein
MGDKINIEMKTPNKGAWLSRTSYNSHQVVNAKVIGVLKYNNIIREQLLNRNIGLYPLLHKDEGIGYISNLYSHESSKPLSLGEEGLLGHTHVYESDYQSKINKKYDIGDHISYYQHGSLEDANALRWNGEFDDYTEYMDKILGVPADMAINFFANLFKKSKLETIGHAFSENDALISRSILTDILQYDNIKYAMEKTRIGTINPNPVMAISGAITTNINNFIGTDTRLGRITNYLYARTLNNAAHFNSLRKTRYITPDVYSSIGNKLSTVSLISSDFRIDDETGRIAVDFSSNNGIINYENNQDIQKGVIDEKRDIADNVNARYKNMFFGINGQPKKYTPLSKYSKDTFARANVGLVHNVTYSWNEGENNSVSPIFAVDSNVGEIGFLNSDLLDDNSVITDNSLLEKTYKLFAKHENTTNEGKAGCIDTLVGRFHTTGYHDLEHNDVNLLQSAVSTVFGMSHGRNLLTKNAYDNGSYDKVHGYSNPYCRVWTYHHQYNNVRKLIRPFADEESVLTIEQLQSPWKKIRTENGAKRLNDNTVLNKNGFVNITPLATNVDKKYDVKKCMFSIENLAWKDVDINEMNLSAEQRGPNGGRIMWFPPYDLKFNENVSVNWNPVDFIGRGEKVYTYTNTERTGTLSFMLLVDHPSILDVWKNNNGKDRDDDSDEQALLRFFAGCEVLEIDNQSATVPQNGDNPNPNPDTIPIEETPDTENIIFYIFFPNNYSGVDVFDSETQFPEACGYLCESYEGSDMERPQKYRSDSALSNQKLNKGNDYDYANYKLNYDLASIQKHDGYNDATHTFSQAYIDGFESNVLQNIVSVNIEGYASSHGSSVKNNNENSNSILSQNRAKFAKKFCEKYLNVESDKITTTTTNIIPVETRDLLNVSGESAKLARCAKVIITLKARPVIDNKIDSETNTQVGTDEAKPATFALTRKKNPEQEVSEKSFRKELKTRRKYRRHERRTERLCRKSKLSQEECDSIKGMVPQTLQSTNTIGETTATGYSDLRTHLNTYDEANTFTKRIISGSVSSSGEYKRWEDEAQYFKMLEDNDYTLYKRIIDKIKYFTPAFHSITPEGFNARLSFLHQCTRQGHTYSVSDTGNSYKSAGNLAFGRPPVCVLRIGDFYHTKIIIDSVTIDYENPQWDMNSEGIGMQPMYAKISLNFKFLGGSDIEAPISRLQNAISFNYYANQSIYDDRSDKGYYDGNEPKISGKPWKPLPEGVTNTTE